MNELPSAPRHRVLLAEDDLISQQIVHVLLQGVEGVELRIVGDGRAALEAALTDRYDLLILDQNLPEITGDRIVRHLRAGNTRNSATPVLRFSAEIDGPGRRQSGAGVEALLPKPLAGDVFVDTVRALLGYIPHP